MSSPNPRLPTCQRHLTSTLCATCLRHRLSLLHPDRSATSTARDTTRLPLRRCNTFSANASDRDTARDATRRSCDGNSLEREQHCDFELPRVSDVDEFAESKTMKEFIDLEVQSNTNPNSRRSSSFWVGASVFSTKLQKWRKHQGTGRAQCDTNPRFSIDLGRSSVDCGRISETRPSLDAPRASLDGRKTNAPVVSVIENAMATVYGFDHRMLASGRAKKTKSKDEKGFDGSSSLKAKPSSNSAIGIFNGSKLLITEKELYEWRLNSLKNVDDNDDDSSESYETASKELVSISPSKDLKKPGKHWSIWGVLHWRKGDKHDKNSNLANNSAMKRGEEVVVDRKRTLGHRPNDPDNGVLRLQPTPAPSRSSKLEDSRLKNSHSLTRTVVRL